MVYPSLAMTGVFRRNPPDGLAVVTYHGVRPEGYTAIDYGLDGNLVSKEAFQKQLRLLKSHYTLISPEDVLGWRRGQRELPPRAVLLTCDDGLVNCLTDMLPILQQEDVRCLFFATGASAGNTRTMLWYEDLLLLLLRAPEGWIRISTAGITIEGELRSPKERRTIWWNTVKQLSRLDAGSRDSFLCTVRTQLHLDPQREFADGEASCRRFGLLTGAELKLLTAAGMTIGAHTMSHPMLSQLPPELANSEIAESRTRLASVIGKPVWAFAYPFGDAQSVTPQVIAMAQEAGFEASFLNFGGGLGADLPPHALPRIHVTAAMTLAEFEAHVSGFHAHLQRLAVRKSPKLRSCA